MAVVTVIGEVVLDRFIADDSSHDVAGGSSANTALAMHVAGHDVRLRARYSIDESGQFLKAAAQSEGLNIDDAVDAHEPATTVEILLSRDGAPTYNFSMNGTADWQWSADELDSALPENTQAIVTGSLVSVFLPGADRIFEWAQSQRKSGVILAYDPNARPSAISSDRADEVRERIKTWVRESDIVKVSDEDISWISPAESPQKVAQQWSLLGPKLVVLTAGAEGARAYMNGREIGHRSAPVISVEDTVGAGDTLMAWLVADLVDSHESIRFTNDNVLKVLERAVRAAAVTCTRKGCKPPVQADVVN